MRKGEYQARAQRFLTGEFHVEDLSTLFLFLRQHSYGRETVYDIGNMLGHGDERDQGISLRRVSDTYVMAQYQIPKAVEHPNFKLYLGDAPPNLFEIMTATLRSISDEKLPEMVGRRRDQASTALAKLRRKFRTKSDGRLEWALPSIHVNDIALIQRLTSHLISKPAYSGDELLEETWQLFLRHGFAREDQHSLLIKRRPHLLLFAIAAMHGVRYLLPDGKTAEAEAGWVTTDDVALLSVYFTMSAPYRDKFVSVGFPVFVTDLSAREWVEDFPDLRHGHFKTPIELTPKPSLRALA